MVDWRGRKQSDNVIDMRGRSPSSGMGRRSVRTGGGIGLAGVIVLVMLFFMGADPMQLLGIALGGDPGAGMAEESTGRRQSGTAEATDEGAAFMGVILEDTEQTWGRLFAEAGSNYLQPKLVLFEGAIDTDCGFGDAAAGPFYCPADRQLYLDLSFFRELGNLGAPGDFAQAYVIGHEVGHHVQNITGTLERVQQLKGRASKVEANALQVLVELQADCFAGVWANHAQTQRDLLESGDVEEGLEAAAAIGDDALQRRAGRRVNPESFTHGSSAERVRWFKRGMQSGNVRDCDTFGSAGVGLR